MRRKKVKSFIISWAKNQSRKICLLSSFFCCVLITLRSYVLFIPQDSFFSCCLPTAKEALLAIFWRSDLQVCSTKFCWKQILLWTDFVWFIETGSVSFFHSGDSSNIRLRQVLLFQNGDFCKVFAWSLAYFALICH